MLQGLLVCWATDVLTCQSRPCWILMLPLTAPSRKPNGSDTGQAPKPCACMPSGLANVLGNKI